MKYLYSLILSLLLASSIYAGELDTKNPDFILKVGAGKVRNITGVTLSGIAPSGIQITDTDIWSLSDATPDQQVWLAPTAAAYHYVVSDATTDTSAVDATGDATGFGARTLRLWGLADWDTEESSEIISMDGTADATTDNKYVIIHRMEVLTSGTSSINVGKITATSVGAGNQITAVIAPGVGKTEMAIYGVPSTQDFYLTRFSASINEATTDVATADFKLLVNPNADTQTTNFITEDHLKVQSSGDSSEERNYKYYLKFPGPCIIKVTAVSSAADLDGHAGFDGILVKKILPF